MTKTTTTYEVLTPCDRHTGSYYCHWCETLEEATAYAAGREHFCIEEITSVYNRKLKGYEEDSRRTLEAAGWFAE